MRFKINKQFIFLIVILFSIQFIISQGTISDDTKTPLYIFGGIQCDVNGDYGNPSANWIDHRVNPQEIRNSLGDCLNNDVNVVGSNVCCPLGYECNSDGNFCQFTGIEYCNQLESSEKCGAYTDAIAINSVERIQPLITCDGISNEVESDGNICFNTNKCTCIWEVNSCNTKVDDINECIDNNNPIGTCTWKLKNWDDLCKTQGIIRTSWEVTKEEGSFETSTGPSGSKICENKNVDIPCESIFKLEFFTPLNIIITIIVIILIYLFLSKIKTKNIKNKR